MLADFFVVTFLFVYVLMLHEISKTFLLRFCGENQDGNLDFWGIWGFVNR